jgi:hypothetical protein
VETEEHEGAKVRGQAGHYAQDLVFLEEALTDIANSQV